MTRQDTLGTLTCDTPERSEAIPVVFALSRLEMMLLFHGHHPRIFRS